MTDRELLELAAKAAGYKPDHVFGKGLLVLDGEKVLTFQPLTDDGDALRLAVKLELDVFFSAAYVRVCNRRYDRPLLEDVDGVDSFAATRRAIVRAAASIAKAIP